MCDKAKEAIEVFRKGTNAMRPGGLCLKCARGKLTPTHSSQLQPKWRFKSDGSSPYLEGTWKSHFQDLKSCEDFPREGSSPSPGTLLTRGKGGLPPFATVHQGKVISG